jgi:lipid-binding SYLF domain-containing protein
MKKLTLGLVLLAMAMVNSAFALEKAELDMRIQSLTTAFAEMQEKPDKNVPAEILAKAQGVILLRRTKGGLVFGYQHGDGVAMVRDANGTWSAPAFMSDNEGSFGAQVGGETSLFVILLMTTNSFSQLTDGKVQFTGEARGTIGDASTGQEGKMNDLPPVLVFSDRYGLFGGAAVKGGAVAPNPDADVVYYGKPITTREILFDKKVKPGDAGTALAKKLTDCSKQAKR